ncbi:hypothetical protein [Brasilonema sp. UFV-L1]|uniref:hypothetical protein n=1 Tax=Brasilonema sp. UFV-L1 TaxID=2234130 RepID=UPI001B7CF563|nr:hypothetical protein [Brasilonema sp. UFV-L1]
MFAELIPVSSVDTPKARVNFALLIPAKSQGILGSSSNRKPSYPTVRRRLVQAVSKPNTSRVE